jgi:hypothetical protein
MKNHLLKLRGEGHDLEDWHLRGPRDGVSVEGPGAVPQDEGRGR